MSQAVAGCEERKGGERSRETGSEADLLRERKSRQRCRPREQDRGTQL